MSKLTDYIKKVINNTPEDWLKLTTHRLDIYNEDLAKTEFLERFEELYSDGNSDVKALSELPTSYDYIRLGHPLSTVLEWSISKINELKADRIISFSSKTMPILAVLRKNLFDQKKTQILYVNDRPQNFDEAAVKSVYGYNFELKQIQTKNDIPDFDGTTILIDQEEQIGKVELNNQVDFYLNLYGDLGSIIIVNGDENEGYISDIQHVRRRESIAMTPANCYAALKMLIGESISAESKSNYSEDKKSVIASIKKITASNTDAILASSGLSMQYAIMMGLIDYAQQKHNGKAIKIIVPPNCYGGTNDQARRVAACLPNVSILDLPVDGDNDMVQSTDQVLQRVADEDAVPLIIAEIPTNPRVEVPNLEKLKEALSKKRQTPEGNEAVAPVFILDQTFCPNVQFLSENGIFSDIQTISYVSGSKFPSGGKCTAGYCVANNKAADLMSEIEKHLQLCDNAATALQVEILTEQLPSMNQRIADAYENTREFVEFIRTKLPEAKINFVSEELANEGFTPSVFSLDMPTKGNTDEEREEYKRALNLKLINKMIGEIPNESKYCVSYGQLKGCYWTIPATSTQGTTKEDDKDYIARVSVSPNLDLQKHKEVFLYFISDL